MHKNTAILIFLSFFLGLTLVGCGEKAPDPESLEKRVTARWESLINQDFKQAYTFFTPAYKKLYPLEHYLQNTGSSVKWTRVKVIEKLIDGNRAEVVANVRYKLNLPGPGADMGEVIGTLDKNMQEVWLWQEENWWYANKPDSRL